MDDKLLSIRKWSFSNCHFQFLNMHVKPWTRWHSHDMDVSENRGTPKSSILIGFSIINHPFWGTPIFGKHPYTWDLSSRCLRTSSKVFNSVTKPLDCAVFATSCAARSVVPNSPPHLDIRTMVEPYAYESHSFPLLSADSIHVNPQTCQFLLKPCHVLEC